MLCAIGLKWGQGAEGVVAEDASLDGDTTEAEAWAHLAARSLKALPLTFPSTGCRTPVTCGVLPPGDGTPILRAK